MKRILVALAAAAVLMAVALPVSGQTIRYVSEWDYDPYGETVSGDLVSLHANDTDYLLVQDTVSGASLDFDGNQHPNGDVGTPDWYKTGTCAAWYQCVDEGNSTDGNTTVIVAVVDGQEAQFNLMGGMEGTDALRLWFVGRSNSTGNGAVVTSYIISGLDGDLVCAASTWNIDDLAFVQFNDDPLTNCLGQPWTQARMDALKILFVYTCFAACAPLTVTATALAFWASTADYSLEVHAVISQANGPSGTLQWACVGTDSLQIAVWNGTAYYDATTFCTTTLTDRNRTVNMYSGLARFRITDTSLLFGEYNVSFAYLDMVPGSPKIGGASVDSILWLAVVVVGFSGVLAVAWTRRKRGA